MIIHRPNRGGLKESMKEAREFQSLGDCIKILIDEHNYSCPIFQVCSDDIVICSYGADERVGWHDEFIICCVPYSQCSNKTGYRFFYGEEYKHPLALFGFFSTNYDK